MNADLLEQPDLIADLQARLDRVDIQLIGLIRQRAEIAKLLMALRAAHGGTRFAHEPELAVVRRFSGRLGPAGAEIAVILLRQARD